MPSISQWDLSLPTEGDRLTRRNQISAFYGAGDWKRQTILGRYRCKHGEPQAAYSVGVGAAFYATELMRRGQALGAGRWATEALSAWDRYFSTRPARNRFDTLTFQAVALAVLGRFDEAEEELKVVAGLIGKDIRETTIYDVADRLSWCRRGLKIR